jgi:hypothetical protein
VTTSVDYSDIEERTGESFQASASGRIPSQSDVTAIISKADTKITLASDVSEQSTERDLLVEELSLTMYYARVHNFEAAKLHHEQYKDLLTAFIINPQQRDNGTKYSWVHTSSYY